MDSIEYVGLASFDTSYYHFATKKYPKFKVKDFLIEEERVWEPMYIYDKKINMHDAMADHVMKINHITLWIKLKISLILRS